MKKIIIIICIIISIILITLGIFISLARQNDNNEEMIGDFSRKLLGRVTICKKCALPNSFPYYSFTHTNKDIQDVLDNLNKEIEKRYKDSSNSLTSEKEECSSIKDKYIYGVYSITDYYLYENDEYISISYRFQDANKCKNKLTITNPKVYIYSKKTKRFITQEEFMKLVDKDEEAIHNYIDSYILTENKTFDSKYSLDYLEKDGKEDYMLFYNNEGNLALYFYQSVTDEYIYLDI